MNRTFQLKIAATGRMRGEIAARIAGGFHDTLRESASRVSLTLGSSDSELGGTGAPLVVGRKKYDLAFSNPAALARVALLGRGFYKTKISLRSIGVFPSWDRLVFAVHRRTGIRSLEELREKRCPLRVSTRRGVKFHSTLFAINEVLKTCGIRLTDIEAWGGKIVLASNPSSADRKVQIEKGEVDAVFDEGVKSWGALALQCGMRFLPLGEAVLRRMERMGYARAAVTPKHYPQLDESVETLDFSGWLLFCHRDLPGFVAYELAEKVDECHEKIPVDHFDGRSMTMEEFCRGGEGGPLSIPLHAGAKKYFGEKGYLS